MMEEKSELMFSPEALAALRELAQQSGIEAATDDDVVDSIRDLYGNVGRDDVFTYTFKDETSDITIELDGVKQELGQTLDSTGLTIWRAAEHLAQFIFHHRQVFAGKAVAELGAGLGLCSILLGKLSVASRVVVTDGDDDTLRLLERNCQRNHAENIPVRKLYWGDHDEFLREFPDGFDTLIGADIIYEKEAVDPLFRSAKALLERRGTEGQFVLSFARRNVSILKVFAVAEKYGFEHSTMEEDTSLPHYNPEEPIYCFRLVPK